jgi:hypothetical protein
MVGFGEGPGEVSWRLAGPLCASGGRSELQNIRLADDVTTLAVVFLRCRHSIVSEGCVLLLKGEG